MAKYPLLKMAKCNNRQVIVCPKCKGSKKQGAYLTMLFPPMFLLARFMDWVGGDSPVDMTYEPCTNCDGDGWVYIGEERD